MDIQTDKERAVEIARQGVKEGTNRHIVHSDGRWVGLWRGILRVAEAARHEEWCEGFLTRQAAAR